MILLRSLMPAIGTIAAVFALPLSSSAAPIGHDLGKQMSRDFDAFNRGETNICQSCDFRDYRFPPTPDDDAEFYHFFKSSLLEKDQASLRPAEKRTRFGANSSIIDESEIMQQKLEALKETHN